MRRLAEEATNAIAGLIRNGQLVFRDFQIPLSDPQEQNRIAVELDKLLSEVSSDRAERRRDLTRLQAEIVGNESAGPYRRAAYAIFTGIHKTDVCCLGALEYPDDPYLHEVAMVAVMANFEALDKIFSKEAEAAGTYDPTPAYALFSRQPAIGVFLEKKFGL